MLCLYHRPSVKSVAIFQKLRVVKGYPKNDLCQQRILSEIVNSLFFRVQRSDYLNTFEFLDKVAEDLKQKSQL